MKKIIILFLFLGYGAIAQNKITLEECYQLADKNYPIAKQEQILKERLSYEVASINKDKLPKIALNAQATYQSDVTKAPAFVPAFSAEPLNKDQYRSTLDINQIIYNGGSINANAKLKEAQTKTLQQQSQITLYKLKSQINQYYFTVLIIQNKISLLLAKKNLLNEKIKEIKTGVKFGAVLPSSEDVIEAEIIKINQQLVDSSFEKKKLIENLSELTLTPFDENTVLSDPTIAVAQKEITRPELAFYDLQNQQLETSKNVVSKSNFPKINAFAQMGYGNPGLDMLKNEFTTFYITGLKLNWNILDWNKTKKDLVALDFSKQLIANEKETFELNVRMQLQETEKEIQKIEELISSDKDIILLREKIVKSADSQMRNGVITTSEYLNEVTQLFESKNNQKTHEVQLNLTKANYQIIQGK
ncbi:MAG: TolC family protein [Flavobacterium sp.]